MDEYNDIKLISDTIDNMMLNYLSVLRPMQALGASQGIEFHHLKKPRGSILTCLNLHEYKGVCDLARSVGVSEKSIGRYIKEMVSMGLIERSADTEDLRVGRLYITQKGRSVLKEQEEFAFDYMKKRFLDGLSKSEQQELVEVCKRAGELFGKVLEYGKELDEE